MSFISCANKHTLIFLNVILEAYDGVKVMKCTIIIPDDIVIDSAVLELKIIPKTRDRISNPKKGKRAKFWHNKCSDDEEPDEGLLFEELY